MRRCSPTSPARFSHHRGKTVARIQQEAGTVVGAAIHTSKATLSVTSFHILHDPETLRRSTTELREARFNNPENPTWPELEQLPYLTAVIKEGLRLSSGVIQHLPCISKHKAIQYGNYSIPPGTPFSKSSYIQHTSPIFNDCFAFNPDPWLMTVEVAPAPGREEKHLDRIFVPFCKGTKSCLGQHLAWADYGRWGRWGAPWIAPGP